MQLRIFMSNLGGSLLVAEGTSSPERRMRKWLPQDLSDKLKPSITRIR
jgi:hypothetical protein